MSAKNMENDKIINSALFSFIYEKEETKNG